MFASAMEVVFSSALFSLFVYLEDYAKITQPNFAKFGRKVAQGGTRGVRFCRYSGSRYGRV